MSLASEIAEHYQQLIGSGELEPEDAPGARVIRAEWGCGPRVATQVRTLLLASGCATKITASRPLGPVSDMDWAFLFLPFVQPRNLDGCLIWDGDKDGRGYGKLLINGRRVKAHRVAYEYRYGPVPPMLELDHVFERGCRSKLCVNHEHLEAVTTAENQRRRHAAARHMASIEVRTELDEG